MIGLRFHYFTVPWNVFDFLLVLASILGILMEDVMIDFPVSPTLLRVVRVFRIGRILRLIKVRGMIHSTFFAILMFDFKSFFFNFMMNLEEWCPFFGDHFMISNKGVPVGEVSSCLLSPFTSLHFKFFYILIIIL